MSYNPNFYNNFRGNDFTFQNRNSAPSFVPPPPRPPSFFLPPTPMTAPPPPISDQDFIKLFEKPLPDKQRSFENTMSIHEMKETMQEVVSNLNLLKEKQKILEENVNTVPKEEWTSSLKEIEQHKMEITERMSQINDTLLSTLRKLLTKRTSKRLRLKRVRKERQIEQMQRVKEMKEKSRKIDENLQKIKEDIEKAKQEEESKIRADIILKETLRKKNDANKCVVKLDALMKLRRARQNTAKGRGETVSESDSDTFVRNIEKLKSLWAQKLTCYEKEESEIRAKLRQDSDRVASSEKAKEREMADNLTKWRRMLFGGDVMPQVDFHGDVGAFVNIRSQWDVFMSVEGSPLPVGWVTPKLES